MIAKMAKYDFVLYAAQSEDFIEKLRELGLVDITTTGWEPSEEDRQLLLDIEGHAKAFEFLRNFRAEVAQEFERLGMSFDVEQQLAVLLGGFPARGGDVHQAEFAQLFDKILALRRIEHKVVFRHFRYHNVAPSPACCCLVFTIFWADLERFSSSSMKRLILRMASSYPGICTFSYKFTF